MAAFGKIYKQHCGTCTAIELLKVSYLSLQPVSCPNLYDVSKEYRIKNAICLPTLKYPCENGWENQAKCLGEITFHAG